MISSAGARRYHAAPLSAAGFVGEATGNHRRLTSGANSGVRSNRRDAVSGEISQAKDVYVVWLYAQEATGSGGLGALLPLLLFGGAAYFLIMRPQRARARRQQELSTTLEIGDQVQTIAGVFGVVVSIDGDAVVLGLEEGRMRVAKRAIAQRITADEDDE